MSPGSATRPLCAALAVVLAAAAGPAHGQSPESMPAVQPLEAGQIPGVAEQTTAASILAGQPEEVLARLEEKRFVVMQEVVESGALSGGMINAYVIFEQPIERVYRFLSQTARQTEFQPEMSSIETVETTPNGRIEECRLKILFRQIVYRLAYEFDPAARRIAWTLDPRFDNDLLAVDGSWELYEMEGDRTLGRFGTSIDVDPAVPAFLQDWVTRKNMPKTMDRARRWVDSEGRYRP